MEKITNDVAEVLVLQDKIFKGNFLKLLKIYVKIPLSSEVNDILNPAKSKNKFTQIPLFL